MPVPEGTYSQEWSAALADRFHAAHEKAYGFRVDDEPVELVNLRSTAVGKIRRPGMKRIDGTGGTVRDAVKSTRPVYFDPTVGYVDTTVYDRSKLPPESHFEGPAIIEEVDSTTVVLPGWSVEVDQFANLKISR